MASRVLCRMPAKVIDSNRRPVYFRDEDYRLVEGEAEEERRCVDLFKSHQGVSPPKLYKVDPYHILCLLQPGESLYHLINSFVVIVNLCTT